MIALLLATLAHAEAEPTLLDTVEGWGDRKWGEQYPGPSYKMKDGRVFRIACEAPSSSRFSDALSCPNAPASLWDLPIRSVALSYDDGTLTTVAIRFEGDACPRLDGLLGPSTPFIRGDAGKEWSTATRRARVYLCSDMGTELEIEYTGETVGVPGTLSYLAAKKDFRGLAWGSAPEPGMKQAGTEPHGIRHMTRPGEELKLGEYPLSGVTYSYFDDRLFMVTVVAPAESARGVLDVLRQAYGPPRQENPYIEDWDWRTSKVRLGYEIAVGTNRGEATFIHSELFSEYMKAREDAASAATQGL